MLGLPSLDKMIVEISSTLRDAMKVIEENSQGICFVTENGVLKGVLSDGDIRRALIDGALIDHKLATIITGSFIALPVNASIEAIQKILGEGVEYIPLIDGSGVLTDYACSFRYHHVPLIQPVLDGNELEYVTECITTGWISSQGRYVSKFENNFCEYVGSNSALAVSNGTVALHLALLALGIGEGDEVLVPDLTFAATINAVLYVGATPVLVDIDKDTLGMDINLAENLITKKTKAIIPVHLYGHPVDMSAVINLRNKYGIKIIEDCAESLGSYFKGNHVGTFSDIATFSFFGNKTITTGEGGMLIFQDPEIKEKAAVLRDHGMSKERRYWHDLVGFNYRLTNIQAAIGVAQLERVKHFVEQKRWNALEYERRLSGIQNITLPRENGNVVNSYWFYAIVLNGSLSARRDEVIDLMLKCGIEARPIFYPLHDMPPYKKYIRDGQNFPVACSASQGGICLPSAVTMTEKDIDKVCIVLKNILQDL